MYRSTGSECQTTTTRTNLADWTARCEVVQGQQWSQGRGSHRVTAMPVHAGKKGSNRQHNPTVVQVCRLTACRWVLVPITAPIYRRVPVVARSSQRRKTSPGNQARTVRVTTPSTRLQTGRPSQSNKDEEYMASSYCGQLTDRQTDGQTGDCEWCLRDRCLTQQHEPFQLHH